MRPQSSFHALAIAIGATLVLAACGGNATPRSTTPTTPTPTTPTPAPAPTPTPTPTPTPAPAPTPAPSAGTVQYQVTLHADGGLVNPVGSVAVMANGDVTVQVNGAASGGSYTVEFCPFPATIYNGSCMTGLATLIADTSGKGQVTFHFPKSGNWAGIFHVMNGTTSFAETAGTNSSFASTDMELEPDTQTNPQGTGNFAGAPQDPAIGNIVAPGNGSVHVAISKAAGNVTYDVTVSYMGGSSSYHIGNLMTNANGDGAADFHISGAGIAIFNVERNGAAGLVSGFHVP